MKFLLDTNANKGGTNLYNNNHTHPNVWNLIQKTKEIENNADKDNMENLNGFSYLLPKSGSRSQLKRLFFMRNNFELC